MIKRATAWLERQRHNRINRRLEKYSFNDRNPGVSGLEKRKRRKVEKAFRAAIGFLPHLFRDERCEFLVSEMGSLSDVLGPRLSRERYSVAMHGHSYSSLQGHLGQVSFGEMPNFNSHLGTTIYTVADSLRTRARSDLPFHSFSIKTGPETDQLVRFTPPTGDDYAPPFSQVSSFAHVLLVHTKGKPIVFVPVVQKITGESKREGRLVDPFVGEHGPDRHFLLLGVARKIVERMKQLGVEAELHVPTAEQVTFEGKRTASERTKAAARRPFVLLGQHFEKSEIGLSGLKVHTLNLSHPKKVKRES